MTHRAESILEAVKTTLTGLATTGSTVDRDRVYPPESLPALSINQGEENPVSDPNMQFLDVGLDIDVRIQVKSANYRAQYNQIKAEVFAALMADRTLGLSYVHDVQWLGDTRPDASGDAEQKTISAEMRFTVFYRHSLTSKEA